MRDIPVGNGTFLVNFDDKYQIRDIYFPRVGQENHTKGYPSRFGIWIDGVFSWISANDWTRDLGYLSETLTSEVILINETLGVNIHCNDTVLSDKNIFLRKIVVSNLNDSEREVRLFFHQDFRIYETKAGDTAFYDPESHALIHYKKDRHFLINTSPSFASFTTGRKAFRDKVGTWRDAEDGELHESAITEGSVDSTIQVNLDLPPNGNKEFFYWIAAGKTHDAVYQLNDYVHQQTPEECKRKEKAFGHEWLNRRTDFGDLSPAVIDLYKRSLLIIRTQIDNGGAIIAANDSDVTRRATDHYSYLWTRDGAFVANALDHAGYPKYARKFFELCARILHKDGYFVQKYNADGTVASGWHARWDPARKRTLLPIQEDETALVIWALWQHYEKFGDTEFVEKLYNPLVIKCADFMVSFRENGLPRASWNLWENSRGIHTFTCCSVIAALRAAAKFAIAFDENDKASEYEAAAAEMKEALIARLYSKEKVRFLRAQNSDDDEHFTPDSIVDASMFGLWYFDIFSADNEMVQKTMRAIEKELWVGSDVSDVGGVARFEHDEYMKASGQTHGNPWFICTLWLAEYRIALASEKDHLKGAVEILEWTAKNALPSGVLAEQLDPTNGDAVSVSPLTWSHSAYVATVVNYVDKFNVLTNHGE